MSVRANYFKLGLFILSAIALGVGFLVFLGLKSAQSDAVTYETYFDETVQGLDVGAPVKYRGVKIGVVESIGFTQREYGGGEGRRYVLARMEIQPGVLDASRSGALDAEIARGLRTQLRQQGITGVAYIGLDYQNPALHPILPIEWSPTHPHIPSTQSTFSQLGDHLENIGQSLDRIRDFDFRELLDQVAQLVGDVGVMIEGLRMEDLQNEAVGLMVELRQTNENLRAMMAKEEIEVLLRDGSAAATGARRLIENELPASLSQMDRTLKRVGLLVNAQQDQVSVILRNLTSLTENLEDITVKAQLFPGQMLFGTPESPLLQLEESE